MERRNEATKCLGDFIRILGNKNEEFIGTYNTIHTSKIVPIFISQVCAKHEINLWFEIWIVNNLI